MLRRAKLYKGTAWREYRFQPDFTSVVLVIRPRSLCVSEYGRSREGWSVDECLDVHTGEAAPFPAKLRMRSFSTLKQLRAYFGVWFPCSRV